MSQPQAPTEPRVSRKALLAGGAAAAAGTGVAIGIALSSEEGEPKAGGPLRASYTAAELPVDDLGHQAWRRATPAALALVPQQSVPPVLHDAAIDRATVRAIHNGEELAFLLDWRDEARDDLDGIARFRDAVAVMLPAKAGKTAPAITMGTPGAPVHILQWRATWQRDVEGNGRTGLDELYPRAIRDLTPEELLSQQAAAPYYPGRAVGNPLSALERSSPVEEIVAEGFGSVTNLEVQRARGNGVHDGKRWKVVLALPMERAPAGRRILPGSTWPVAFAVWLGDKDNRGARKHYADWVQLDIAPER